MYSQIRPSRRKGIDREHVYRCNGTPTATGCSSTITGWRVDDAVTTYVKAWLNDPRRPTVLAAAKVDQIDAIAAATDRHAAAERAYLNFIDRRLNLNLSSDRADQTEEKLAAAVAAAKVEVEALGGSGPARALDLKWPEGEGLDILEAQRALVKLACRSIVIGPATNAGGPGTFDPARIRVTLNP